ncbi:MAG: glycosyltransferase family 4 protein [Nitrospinota bacterium]
MRVAIFRELPYDFPGGVSNLLTVLLDYLERHGHEARVFIADDGNAGPTQGPFVGFPTVTTRALARSRFCLPVPRAARMRRELEAFQPDVVHFLHPLILGPMGSYYARQLKVARVASFHTLYQEYALYHGVGFLSRTIRWWAWMVFKDCHVTLAPSASVAEDLCQWGLKRVDVWPRGVDFERFHPRWRSEDWRVAVRGADGDGRPVIIYVGRLAKEKNMETLMALARILKGVHWVIVGDGPERGVLSEALRGVRHTFTGYLTGEELATTYASSDLFFMPSLTEGCPNAVMEAFASGLPVVGAAAYGTKDLIVESGAGLAFPSHDVAEASRQVETLLTNPALAASCGARGRAFAESRSWDTMMDQLVKHYSKARALNGLAPSAP